MKNIALCIALILCNIVAIQAQSFLLNENFSSTTGRNLPSGWTHVIINGDTAVDRWTFGKHPKFYFAPPIEDGYAIFDSYNGGATGGTASNGQPETVALVSPSINTNSLSNLYLAFDYMNLYNGGTAYLDVSIDGGTNWTPYASYNSITSTPVSVLYNFSAYIGFSAFKIRMRWNNPNTANYQGFIAFDNLKLFSRYSTDASLLYLNPMYDKSCPSTSQAINVVIKNEGTASLSNIPIVVNVTGAITTTLNYTYSGTLASESSVDVAIGNINTTNGGTFNFSASVNYSGDGNSANNTYKSSRISAAIASNPSAIDGFACGQGKRVSLSVSKSSADSTFWYAQASGGSIIAEGNPFLTPPLTSTTTFYAQNARLFQNDQWAFQGPYRFNGIQYTGSYFDVKATNELLIDSFWQHFAYSGNYDVSVYYKSGTFSGFESNSSAWTLHQKVSLSSNGFGQMVGIKLSKALHIPAGNLVGIYLLVDGLSTNKSVTFKTGSLNFSNSDLSISAGSVSNNSFAGVSGYSWDGRLFYRKLCLSNRVGVKATIKPTPTGASLIKGSPFEGKFNTGSMASSDVLELNKTNAYELLPPTGFTNANHSTKWKINTLKLITSGGYTLPTADYSYTLPTSSGANARISFKAIAKYLDSFIIIRFNFSDLGPYYCDSSVERIIRIAPTPKPNFIFTKPACDGIPIVFENRSTIHSGNLSYKWYFGDGDSSDLISPIHLYKTYGTYCVKMLAIHAEYGVMRDTTLCVLISEIPKPSFKVSNACKGENLSFSNLSTIGTGSLSYDWDFGDGSTHSTLQNPVHLYANTGGYQVTLTVKSNTNCVAKLTKNASQFLRPVADFSVFGKCSRSIIEFTNNSTIGEGDKIGSHWDFGDGEINNESDPTHIYASGGKKTVKLLTTSQFGCKDSIIKIIDIVEAPNAAFTNGPACSIEPVEFSNSTNEPSGYLVVYAWIFGDGGTSVLKNPSHYYSDLGFKVVTLIATSNNGCQTTLSKTIKILLQPTAGFTAKDVCVGQAVVFSNKTKGGGIISYKWKFGDGDSSSTYFPVKKYSTTIATTYNVTLTAKVSGGCQHSISQPVTIMETPKCTFKFKSAGTGGLEYKFTPTVANYPFYQWSFEGGGISSASNPIHKFQVNGKYKVRVIMRTVDGCECIDSSQYVNVNSLGLKPLNIGKEIQFYPNPNQGNFVIQISTLSPVEPFLLNLRDYTGRLISSLQLKGNQPHQISYESLSRGFYFLEIIKEDGQQYNTMMQIIH